MSSSRRKLFLVAFTVNFIFSGRFWFLDLDIDVALSSDEAYKAEIYWFVANSLVELITMFNRSTK